MKPRKFNEIVPDAMQAIKRMIEKGEREIRKARSVDRGAIRVKSNEKRARQLELTLNK
tara:strand:- start:390 stop:563 length:174 start_codon:yes stop_codon:yes gene_type:complete